MNVLMCCVNAAKKRGDDPRALLINIMMVLCVCDYKAAITAAAKWYNKHGEPTFAKIETWAIDWWNDSLNSRQVETLVESHRVTLGMFPAEELPAVKAFIGDTR